MGRKSKQAGSGHFPLTHHERTKKRIGQGSVTSRLSGISQYTFGDCALQLAPAIDTPVMTPSGYIYERPAILQYLLTKTQELKQAQQVYERQLQQEQALQQQEQESKKRAAIESFEATQKGVAKKSSLTKRIKTTSNNNDNVTAIVVATANYKADNDGNNNSSSSSSTNKSDDNNDNKSDNPLKKSSYWLSEFQPENTIKSKLEAPPKRPMSPNSQQPLRRKDLISLKLERNIKQQVVCAISKKVISTQQAIALIPKKSDQLAPVVLEQVFKDITVKDGNKTISDGAYKKILCPVTGNKIAKICKLQTGGSSFASSAGEKLQAKIYRPSMT